MILVLNGKKFVKHYMKPMDDIHLDANIGAAYNDDSFDDIRLTTGQAAEIVGSSSRTIARLIDSGKLKGIRVGNGRRYVMFSDLLAFDQKAKKDRRAHLDTMFNKHQQFLES